MLQTYLLHPCSDEQRRGSLYYFIVEYTKLVGFPIKYKLKYKQFKKYTKQVRKLTNSYRQTSLHT